MNARLRSIIALLLVLSFGLALPTVHGQQLMIHLDAATTVSPAKPSPPCHAATDNEAQPHNSDGCSQCGDGDCQCQLISLSPPLAIAQLCTPTPAATSNIAAITEAPHLGQLRHPWRPPSINA